MTGNKLKPAQQSWAAGTWEGSRREAQRRWAKLPLEQLIASLEEMEALQQQLQGSPRQEPRHEPDHLSLGERSVQKLPLRRTFRPQAHLLSHPLR